MLLLCRGAYQVRRPNIRIEHAHLCFKHPFTFTGTALQTWQTRSNPLQLTKPSAFSLSLRTPHALVHTSILSVASCIFLHTGRSGTSIYRLLQSLHSALRMFLLKHFNRPSSHHPPHPTHTCSSAFHIHYKNMQLILLFSGLL